MCWSGTHLWSVFYIIKDIVILERIQRRATKFILNDYSSNYKSHLLNLNILSLIYQFDYYDILFFIKHIKYPTDNFNIFNHKYSASNLLRNSYFCRLPKIWNSLPPIDLNQSFTSIRSFIIGIFGTTSQPTLIQIIHVLFILLAYVAIVIVVL